MERTTLSDLVIIFDILVCICFALYIYCMDGYILREGTRLDELHVDLPDFAFLVKNLPKIESYRTLEALRAELVLHIREVIKHEPQVISELEHVANHPVEDVVNIHFA